MIVLILFLASPRSSDLKSLDMAQDIDANGICLLGSRPQTGVDLVEINLGLEGYLRSRNQEITSDALLY